MKGAFVVAVLLAAGELVQSKIDAGPIQEFSGVFFESYEEKIFYPCDESWGNVGWWLRFAPGIPTPFPRYEVKGAGMRTLAHYLRVRGTLSKPGSYGTGFHSRELVVDSVIEVRDTSVSHCKSGFDNRPTQWKGSEPVHGTPASAVTTADRSIVAVADSRGILTLWRNGLAIGRYRYSKPAPNGGVPTTTIAFSPSNQLVAVGTGDGRVRIWNIPNGRLVRELDHSAHTDTVGVPGEAGYGVFVGEWPVTSVAFTSDDSTLVTAGGARAYAWSISSGRRIGVFVGGGKQRSIEPSRLAMLRNPDRVVALGRDGTMRMYAPGGGAPEFVAAAPTVDLMLGQMAISPDERLIAVQLKADSIALWSLETGRITHVLGVPAFYHGGLAFSPDSKLIAVSGGAFAIYLWETESGKPFARLPGPYSGARNMWFTAKGDSIVMSSLFDASLTVIRARYPFDTSLIPR
jgi:WD40 repeat protein